MATEAENRTLSNDVANLKSLAEAYANRQGGDAEAGGTRHEHVVRQQIPCRISFLVACVATIG